MIDIMRALSIRQPYAELILRGMKTIEFRSRPTKLIGERFFIYASKGKGQVMRGKGQVMRGKGQVEEEGNVWSSDLAVPGEPLPPWVLEVAEFLRLGGLPDELPSGMIVGTAVIDRCILSQLTTNNQQPATSLYEWHLTDVRRLSRPRKPTGHPQPVWFKPF